MAASVFAQHREHPHLVGGVASLILLMAKPTWISTQSPGFGGSSCKQPHIDLAPHAGYFDQSEILPFRQDLDDLSRYGEAHSVYPPLSGHDVEREF